MRINLERYKSTAIFFFQDLASDCAYRTNPTDIYTVTVTLTRRVIYSLYLDDEISTPCEIMWTSVTVTLHIAPKKFFSSSYISCASKPFFSNKFGFYKSWGPSDCCACYSTRCHWLWLAYHLNVKSGLIHLFFFFFLVTISKVWYQNNKIIVRRKIYMPVKR